MSSNDATKQTVPSETVDNTDHWTEVGELLASLYRIVHRLEVLFPGRKFTPDGHLVGSIGEVIAARMLVVYQFNFFFVAGSLSVHDDGGARLGVGLLLR